MQRRYIMTLFVLILLGLGLGYASLQTNLNITGTTTLKDNRWDIHLENVQVKTGSVSATTPTINTAKDTVTYNVTLNNLGDFYEFTVDVKNDGSLDGMISNVSSKLNGEELTNLPTALSYSLTYNDGIAIENNHMLKAGEKLTYKLRVGYRTDINISDIPSTQTSLNLALTVSYVQADNRAISKPIAPIYTVSGAINNINAPLLGETIIFYDYKEALNAHIYPFFLKHIIDENNIVTSSYVGLNLNNNIYYLQGAGATPNPDAPSGLNDDSLFYETNKATLVNIFGVSNCSDYETSIVCTGQNLTAGATTSGFVYFDYGNTWYCYVGSDGDSCCAADT